MQSCIFLTKVKNVKCEIQVKGSEEPVSTIRLAECLGHFLPTDRKFSFKANN